ncbi:MAG TPA: hypothetical protein VLL95_15000 [Phnomibacter sp.]|nr:hypothetical protein [Phnomibacter sp.]
MAIYKELQLQSEVFAFPIDIKLNAEDWYVRIGAPLHQVVQIRPHLFNPSLVTVNNLYGSCLFNLVADRKQGNYWTVWTEGTLKADLSLANNTVTIHDKESGQQFEFSVHNAADLGKQEKQMLAAAIMDTWQEISRTAAGTSRAMA